MQASKDGPSEAGPGFTCFALSPVTLVGDSNIPNRTERDTGCNQHGWHGWCLQVTLPRAVVASHSGGQQHICSEGQNAPGPREQLRLPRGD